MPSKAKPTLGLILEPSRTKGANPEPLRSQFFETAMEPDEIKNLDFTCGGFALPEDAPAQSTVRKRVRVRSLLGLRARPGYRR